MHMLLLMNFPALENVTLARTMLGVVTLTLNRADRSNALSLAMLKQLHTAWNALEAATDPRVVIMCSALGVSSSPGATSRQCAPFRSTMGCTPSRPTMTFSAALNAVS